MKEEYQTGYTMGQIRGVNDSNLLVPPYPYTDGKEIYQMGFKNGYLMSYTKGLSNKLKGTVTDELKKIIAERLDDVSHCISLESKQK